jgi:diketogulonate reductase-like aldo/keto reductase
MLYSEDLVGEGLQILYTQHGIKREDLFIQTKYVLSVLLRGKKEARFTLPLPRAV